MVYRKTIIILFLSATLLSACSADNETETNTGKIDTVTKEIGQEAAHMIKSPIDMAQQVADKEEKRTQDLEKRANQ